MARNSVAVSPIPWPPPWQGFAEQTGRKPVILRLPALAGIEQFFSVLIRSPTCRSSAAEKAHPVTLLSNLRAFRIEIGKAFAQKFTHDE